MEKWTELHTAYQVAKLGTVSAAAKALGVHRATITRHIDELETELGGKVFIRHGRGYALTEVGEDLLRVTSTAKEQFQQLAGRTKGRDQETGELIVTSGEIVAPIVIWAMRRFRNQFPNIICRYQVGETLLKLEYGEAHVAIRSGSKPSHPDHVVQHILTLRSGLYAHKLYLATHGMPESLDDMKNHWFIAPDPEGCGMAFDAWFTQNVPNSQIVFRSTNYRIKFQAMFAGHGLCFFPEVLARQKEDVIQILPPQADWDLSFWLVTHVDLHRTTKVRGFLKALKEMPPETVMADHPGI